MTICGRAGKTVRGNKERKKKRFNHQERIEFIYDATVHGKTITKISKDTQQKYTSVHSILKDYKDHGRTNRLLNHQEKVNRLGIRHERNHNIIRLLEKKGVSLELDITEKVPKVESVDKLVTKGRHRRQGSRDSVATMADESDIFNLNSMD